MSNFKKGDRVRVVLEGEVLDVFTEVNGFEMDGAAATYEFYPDDEGEVVSVEKIADAVVTFPVGTVVRHKLMPEYFYTVTEAGVFSHSYNEEYHSEKPINSDEYEAVANG